MHQDIRFYCFIMRVVACSAEKLSLEGAGGVLFTAREFIPASTSDENTKVSLLFL